jgi:hypothetical protein
MLLMQELSSNAEVLERKRSFFMPPIYNRRGGKAFDIDQKDERGKK